MTISNFAHASCFDKPCASCRATEQLFANISAACDLPDLKRQVAALLALLDPAPSRLEYERFAILGSVEEVVHVANFEIEKLRAELATLKAGQ